MMQKVEDLNLGSVSRDQKTLSVQQIMGILFE